MRTGEKRVLIGTTIKMGTGMNVQDRLVSLHHMDCPWRPSDIEQREGRILRQGNMNSEVEVYRYTTKGTLDAFAWQTVEIKQKFIDEIMTGNYADTSTEFESSNAEEFALMKASGVEDPLIKEKMETDNKISTLQKLKKSYQENIYQMEDNLKIHYPKKIEQLDNEIYYIGEDKRLINRNNITDFQCEVDGVMHDKHKEAGTIIISKANTLERDKSITIGSYRGLEISVERTFTKYNIALIGKGKYSVEMPQSAVGCAKALEKIVLRFDEQERYLIKELSSLKNNIRYAEEEIKKPFSKQNELDELIKIKVQIDSEIDSRRQEQEKDKNTNQDEQEENLNNEIDDELEM